MNAPIDKEAEAQALMDISQQWSDLVASGDMEGAMEYWADDAVMMPPDLPVRCGKAAIREYVTGAADIPGFRISWEPEKAYISENADMAYMIERNVTEFDAEDGSKVIVHGKVVTVWRKDSDGQWKNVVDVWNATPPPTG